MTVTEIPRQFKYICDQCGVEHLQAPGCTGHYTESTPPGWLAVRIKDSLNNIGVFRDELFCEGCAEKFRAFMKSMSKGG